MKQFMRVVSFAGALALATSSAHADKAAPPPATPTDAEVQSFLKWFDGLVDIVVADKDDCARMATDINKSIDDNKALLDKAQAAGKSGKQLPAEAKNHMMESAKRMAGAMQKCQSDKAVQAAFARLPRSGAPGKH